jgi:hypothetical protein
MGQRVTTANELREILSVARKLRTSALTEHDEDYAVLFARAADALDKRAMQLAFRPCGDGEYHGDDENDARDEALHRPVDVRC